MNAASTDKPAKSSFLSYALIVLGGLALIGVAVALVLRFFFFVPYKVPAGSMLPTLPPETSISANPSEKPPFARGSVVVFRSPENPKQSFVKRVVGLAEDTVEMKGGHLFINGWEAPRCAVGKWNYFDGEDGMQHAGDLVLEYLDSATYLVFEEQNALSADNQGPYYVAAGQFFVLGDNRANSHDSRMWFAGKGGGVPFDLSQGRVRLDDAPKLPAGAERLKAAFDACVAKRPAQTTPPAAKQ